MPFPGNEIASRNKYLELKHWLMVVNPDEDVAHDELAFVCRKLELGPEGRITNAASDGRRPFAVDEFRQLGSRAVVPDEVGTLHVRVENLQDLERIWNEENCYKITQKYFLSWQSMFAVFDSLSVPAQKYFCYPVRPDWAICEIRGDKICDKSGPNS